jgi:hypothetical protein
LERSIKSKRSFGDEQDGNDCRRVYEASCITTKSIKATSEEVKATEKVGGGRILICT